MTRAKAGAGLTVAGVVVALAVTGVGAATAGQRAHASASTGKLKADPNGNLKYNKRKLKVSAGKVTLVMKNPGTSNTPHGIAVAGHGVSKVGKIVNPGHKSKLKVTLQPGKYVFYRPEDDHRAAGMKGKLIVK